MEKIELQQIFKNDLVGAVLKHRFVIARKIGQGSQGQVFKVIDFENQKQQLVIKFFSKKSDEIKVQKALNLYLVDYGAISHYIDNQFTNILYYFIMPRFGHDLETLFNQGIHFDRDKIYNIGNKTLSCLRKVHEAGYIFNDLKLENLLLDYKAKLTPTCDIKLIDYGFCTKYLKKGKHIDQQKEEIFRGNMLYSSAHQMNFQTTSRRDDIISLFYLISYLLNGGYIDGFQDLEPCNEQDCFEISRIIKENHTIESLCQGPTKCLTKFAQKVFEMEFEEAPDYEELQSLLFEAFGQIEYENLSDIEEEGLCQKIQTNQSDKIEQPLESTNDSQHTPFNCNLTL